MTSALVALLALVVTTLLVRRLYAGARVVRAGAGTGEVSVVVPARDEEASLPALLDSLAAQQPAAYEVVVVDDGSRDATARIGTDAGATVVALDGPPEGWTGKAWACQQGAATADGDLLLFLDADTTLAQGALGALLAEHEREGSGLLSVQPFHAVQRPYEHLSAYPNVVSMLASDVAAQRRPMAFGPCLLTTRAAYEKAGGHAAVRAEVLDDVALARAYARAGLPVRCLVGGEQVRMRMYPSGLRQLVEGWTKNISSGAGAAAPAASVAVVAWVAVHHAVAVGAVQWALTDRSWLPGLLWLVAWVGVALGLRLVLRRLGSFAWWTWVLFPVPLLFFDLVFTRSALLTAVRGSVRWRGRSVRTERGRLGLGDG